MTQENIKKVIPDEVILSGGSAGGKGKPSIADDTMRSKGFARILFIIGEGTIQGLVDGERSIFLDGVPLTDPVSGKRNFDGIEWEIRLGTQNQQAVTGLPGSESESSVNVKVTQASPIVRSLSDPEADRVRIRVGIPQLQEVDDKNNVKQTSVTLAIDATNNSVYEERIRDTIRGKSTAPNEFEYEFDLRGSSPWNIRVRRITADSDDPTKKQNELNWVALTSVVSGQFRYPNTALFLLKFPAETFRSLPQVSLDLFNLIVRHPHNYNPATRVYTGQFNGSLINGYTNNPAWCLYALLTNRRYGVGKYIDESLIDKWSFYAIAQYCDQLVPTGLSIPGRTHEPRFTCNVTLETREDAYKVLNNFVSIFRGMIYWNGSSIVATQDRPQTPTKLYTNSNVIVEIDQDGNLTKPPFIYSGSGLSARHTVALVTWFDIEDNDEAKIAVVRDQEGILRLGYRETEIVALGASTETQALRSGEWLLYSERYETETITFKIGSEGMLCTPGEIVKVMDNYRSGQRFGGRFLASTINTLTLDSNVTVQAGLTYTVSILQTNGAQAEYTVTNAPGTTNILNVAGMPNAPSAGGVWVLASQNLQPQQFRIIAVVENTEDETYEVTGLAHNPGKYAFIEQDRPIQLMPISVIQSPLIAPQAVSYLEISEEIYEDRSGLKTRVTVKFKPTNDPYLDEFELQYKLTTDGQWRSSVRTKEFFFDLFDFIPGVYDFRVRAINTIGLGSNWNQTTQQIFGLALPPRPVTNPKAVVNEGGQITLSWDLHPDIDVRINGEIQIRHTPITTNPVWSDGLPLAIAPGSSTSINLPFMDGSFLLCAVDSGQVRSVEPAIASASSFVASTSKFKNRGSFNLHPNFAPINPGVSPDPPGTRDITYPGIDALYPMTNQFNAETANGGRSLVDLDCVSFWENLSGISSIASYRQTPNTAYDPLFRLQYIWNATENLWQRFTPSPGFGIPNIFGDLLTDQTIIDRLKFGHRSRTANPFVENQAEYLFFDWVASTFLGATSLPPNTRFRVNFYTYQKIKLFTRNELVSAHILISNVDSFLSGVELQKEAPLRVELTTDRPTSAGVSWLLSKWYPVLNGIYESNRFAFKLVVDAKTKNNVELEQLTVFWDIPPITLSGEVTFTDTIDVTLDNQILISSATNRPIIVTSIVNGFSNEAVNVTMINENTLRLMLIPNNVNRTVNWIVTAIPLFTGV